VIIFGKSKSFSIAFTNNSGSLDLLLCLKLFLFAYKLINALLIDLNIFKISFFEISRFSKEKFNGLVY